MSTPISWIEGQARGRFLGFRNKLASLRPGNREHTRTRQKMRYAFKTMCSAEETRAHIEWCHKEIERLGGQVPIWPPHG